jgi:hypothetical protein
MHDMHFEVELLAVYGVLRRGMEVKLLGIKLTELTVVVACI